ncbi:MAG: TetR/AcrR family transcriptional regulator [Desulfobacteraceae bacterium]|nr:TetR/AcrR family transcriptional regulator [Desulfobacteraceae bacterium]
MKKRNKHTKEQLLEKGIELITEHGYHGTGLKKILDTVEVPKGSFYNYFKSKEVFVSEIIRKYSQDILKKVDDYLENTDDDPITAIRNIHHVAIMKCGGAGGCLTGNLAAEIGTSVRSCQIAMNDAVELWKTRFVRLIKQGQKAGSVRKDLSGEVLADILWDIWQGGLLRLKIDGDVERLKTTIDNTLDILFK